MKKILFVLGVFVFMSTYATANPQKKFKKRPKSNQTN